MHASIDQLLSLRDGGPTAAAVAQHVQQCPDCTAEIARLREVRAGLQRLPAATAPDVWEAVEHQLQGHSNGPRWWSVAAVIGLLAVAIFAWQQTGRERAPGGVAVAAAQDVQADVPLPELVARSRQLEQLLRVIDQRSPQRMSADTANTIAGLQERIALIDYGLSNDASLPPHASTGLWQQRVNLMNTLVQVRGVQLQQLASEEL